MPEIRPFNGIRYNPEKVKNLQTVITQPYDQITDEMEKEYKKLNPYNFVNLVLTHYADGHDRPREYRDAAKFVNEWSADGHFIRDRLPSLYPYSQDFTLDGRSCTRRGFFCLVRLEELGEGNILPHEKTLSKPKEDRLNLTRITRKDFEPVFMLYTDPENAVADLIDKSRGSAPLIDVTDDRDVRHKLWQITERGVIDRVAAALVNSTFVIADGHHRYETFLTYSREPENTGRDHAARFKMIVLVNIADRGLVILPTHRLFANLTGFVPAAFIEKAGKYFEVKKTDRRNIGSELQAEKTPAYGFYCPPAAYILKLNDPGIMAQLLKDRSKDYQQLDVAVLHTLLVENVLGVGPDRVEDHIRYQRGIDETLRRVDAGEFQFCFLLNPTRPGQVRDVALNKERMPQKSTDFFPKLISGLVFYDVA